MTTQKAQMTGAEIVAAVQAGTMTKAEVLEILMARMSADRLTPRTITFGKTPANGWTEADRVAK